jgi:hypothetical protein
MAGDCAGMWREHASRGFASHDVGRRLHLPRQLSEQKGETVRGITTSEGNAFIVGTRSDFARFNPPPSASDAVFLMIKPNPKLGDAAYVMMLPQENAAELAYAILEFCPHAKPSGKMIDFEEPKS